MPAQPPSPGPVPSCRSDADPAAAKGMIFLGGMPWTAFKGSPSTGEKKDKRPQRTWWLGRIWNRDTRPPRSPVLGIRCCPDLREPPAPRVFPCVPDEQVATKRSQKPFQRRGGGRGRRPTSRGEVGNAERCPDNPRCGATGCSPPGTHCQSPRLSSPPEETQSKDKGFYITLQCNPVINIAYAFQY